MYQFHWSGHAHKRYGSFIPYDEIFLYPLFAVADIPYDWIESLIVKNEDFNYENSRKASSSPEKYIDHGCGQKEGESSCLCAKGVEATMVKKES